MFPIPYKRQTVESSAPPSRIALAVADLVSSGMLSGTVSSSGFCLDHESVWGRDVYAIRAVGRIREMQSSCTEVDITYKLHPYAVFGILVFAALLIRSGVLYGHWYEISMFLIAHCIGYAISFAPQRAQLESAFSEAIRYPGHAAPPLADSNLVSGSQ
jgi:hypothetical protein